MSSKPHWRNCNHLRRPSRRTKREVQGRSSDSRVCHFRERDCEIVSRRQTSILSLWECLMKFYKRAQRKDRVLRLGLGRERAWWRRETISSDRCGFSLPQASVAADAASCPCCLGRCGCLYCLFQCSGQCSFLCSLFRSYFVLITLTIKLDIVTSPAVNAGLVRKLGYGRWPDRREREW